MTSSTKVQDNSHHQTLLPCRGRFASECGQIVLIESSWELVGSTSPSVDVLSGKSVKDPQTIKRLVLDCLQCSDDTHFQYTIQGSVENALVQSG